MYKIGNIELTTRCNYRCKHCFGYGDGLFGSHDMPLDTVISLIDKYKLISLIGGETTIYKNIRDVLTYCQDNKKIASALTNGSNPDIVIEYPKIVWIVSIDGDKAFHDSNRGTGSYDKAIKTLENAKRGYISSCITDSNEHLIKDMINLADKLKKPIVFCPYYPTTDIVKLKRWIAIIEKYNNGWVLETKHSHKWMYRDNWVDCKCERYVDSYYADGRVTHCLNPAKTINCVGCSVSCASAMNNRIRSGIRAYYLVYLKK